ncbi:D-hexose-6-phosphate mutarotase [Reinekea forsetii]|nr:D-hexose-6-phosphate mutarotase [Reinekea forsetii]
MTPLQISKTVQHDQYNELDCLRINNSAASATIFLQGAHITEYSKTQSNNLLFVSKAEPFKAKEAIRGGIPICWPWFGPHSTQSNAPAHGFARTRIWQYSLVHESDHRTDIMFKLETDGHDIGFPYKATAELLISVGETLAMSLTTTNLGDEPFAISQAMHSYFACEDIASVKVTGLTGEQVLDTRNGASKPFPRDFSFHKETDWTVLDKGQPILLSGTGRPAIQMNRLGSRSVVVWNPWLEKASTLSHFQPQDYQSMFCVETTNAGDDARLIKPKQAHALAMEIQEISAS